MRRLFSKALRKSKFVRRAVNTPIKQNIPQPKTSLAKRLWKRKHLIAYPTTFIVGSGYGAKKAIEISNYNPQLRGIDKINNRLSNYNKINQKM